MTGKKGEELGKMQTIELENKIDFLLHPIISTIATQTNLHPLCVLPVVTSVAIKKMMMTDKDAAILHVRTMLECFEGEQDSVKHEIVAKTIDEMVDAYDLKIAEPEGTA